MKQRLYLIVLSGLMVFIFFSLWPGPGVAAPPEMQPLWLSVVREQAELEQHRSVLDHSGVNRYIEEIVSSLWEHVESDLPRLQVRVLADSQEDAFAYPNGVCYLTSGMLVNTRSRDQLAMILAHEMIHYIRRHAQTVYEMVNSAVQPESAPGLRSSLAAWIQAAERQADREGLRLIIQAGFCPDEALDILAQSEIHASWDRGGRDPIDAAGRSNSYDSPLSGFQRARQVQGVLNELDGETACRVEAITRHYHLDRIAPVLKINARQAIQKGRWIEAADSISRYLSACPDDPQGHFIQGEILRLGPPGDHGIKPETAYQAAIAIDEDFVPALQAMGVLFLKIGQTTKARQYFERCLVLSPQTEGAAYIKRYLQLCGD